MLAVSARQGCEWNEALARCIDVAVLMRAGRGREANLLRSTWHVSC